MSTRKISLPTYDVTVGRGLLGGLGDIVRSVARAHRYAVITDDNVGPHYAKQVRDTLGKEHTSVFTIPAGEVHKTRNTWAQLTDDLLGAGFGRDTTVIALGGGVVGDLAGFVAATFMRGVPVVQVPTTLLAMIDASVGGKTGVDTPAGKNLVGSFHQPAAVVADINVLKTLPPEQLRAGTAEAIKHGVIADAAYFELVSDTVRSLDTLDVTSDALLDIVARSVAIKADVVRRDEREGGVRKTLNFGHTIGHAVELCSNFVLLHGAAVAIGMVYEATLAERLGIAEAGTAERIRETVLSAGLPDVRPSSIAVRDVIVATRGDKKARAGQAEYSLPERIGVMAAADRGYSLPIEDAVVEQVLA